MSEYKDCAFEECKKPVSYGRHCGGHRGQLSRGEEMRPLRGYATSNPLYCSFEGCNRGHFSRGYCQAHARQNRNGQELRPIRKYARKEEQG